MAEITEQLIDVNNAVSALGSAFGVYDVFDGRKPDTVENNKGSGRITLLDHTPEQSFGSALKSVVKLDGCERPIRLSGSLEVSDCVSGDVVHQFNTERDTSDDAIYVPCKTRRASRCQACSRIYQNDAYQLIVGGLRPGDYFDESILSRPALFVTLTAPSFGKVHSSHKSESYCNPRRDKEICPHGKDLTCWSKHSADETCVGQAICKNCFDYSGAVAWNASAGQLWRATIVDFERTLAKSLGVTIKELQNRCRFRFVKIAEMQRRGLVHFHVAIRLDGPDASSPDIDVETLIAAVEKTHSRVSVADPRHQEQRICWGKQIDIKVIGTDIEREKLAGYFAKYATKGADAKGLLDSRIHSEEQIDFLPVSDHQARLIRAAWKIANQARALDERRPPRKSPVGGTVRIIKDKEADCWILTVTSGLAMNHRGRIKRKFKTREQAFEHLRKLEKHPNPLRDLNLDMWAHQFGFRGHFLTKSRETKTKTNYWPGWSTTFKALRQKRADYTAELQRKSWQALSPQAQLVITSRWQYSGPGFRTPKEAHIAALLQGKTEEQIAAA